MVKEQQERVDVMVGTVTGIYDSQHQMLSILHSHLLQSCPIQFAGVPGVSSALQKRLWKKTAMQASPSVPVVVPAAGAEREHLQPPAHDAAAHDQTVPDVAHTAADRAAATADVLMQPPHMLLLTHINELEEEIEEYAEFGECNE